VALILLYHRVTSLARDPQLLTVSPAHFDEHLRVLRERYRPVSLSELVADLRAGAVDDRSVAITFDDGYADNALAAGPALARVGIPATVFVATGTIGTQLEFFWDELDRILLDGTSPGWNVLDADCPTPRHRVYRDLCAKLQSATIADRTQSLDSLRSSASLPPEGRLTRRTMTRDELRALAGIPGIEIGAHTIEHPRLASETVEEQASQIIGSRAQLEEWLGVPVRTFSYPFGTHDAYTPDTVRLVRQAGFDCACANFPRRVGLGTDPFRLPRFVVRDWPADEFRRQLERWATAPVAY
jgi:peptidoglycan/xylan/chitin deacetylase (PgdA/CDA1 family)